MTARTATVQNILLQPGTSAPMVGAVVTFELNTSGFTNGTSETVGQSFATTDATGLWSKTLVINDDIDPAGTSWYVTEPIAGRRSIQLVAANAGQTVNFRAVLVANPSNPNPLTAGVPLPGVSVPSGDVWTTDGAGSGSYQPQAGGGAVASVNGHVGTVVLAASDVGADASGAASTAQTAAIAAAATDATTKANAAQAAAVQRANHTGTQLMATISDAGGAATKNVGTTTGTVAAGDDSRIVGAVQKSLGTAKGDLVGFSASGVPVRIPAGGDGSVPTYDSTAASGLSAQAALNASSLLLGATNGALKKPWGEQAFIGPELWSATYFDTTSVNSIAGQTSTTPSLTGNSTTQHKMTRLAIGYGTSNGQVQESYRFDYTLNSTAPSGWAYLAIRGLTSAGATVSGTEIYLWGASDGPCTNYRSAIDYKLPANSGVKFIEIEVGMANNVPSGTIGLSNVSLRNVVDARPSLNVSWSNAGAPGPSGTTGQCLVDIPVTDPVTGVISWVRQTFASDGQLQISPTTLTYYASGYQNNFTKPSTTSASNYGAWNNMVGSGRNLHIQNIGQIQGVVKGDNVSVELRCNTHGGEWGRRVRTVTDGVVNGTTTLTSATANFTSADVGAAISLTTGMGTGIRYIQSVTDSQTVVMNTAATASGSGVTVGIGNFASNFVFEMDFGDGVWVALTDGLKTHACRRFRLTSHTEVMRSDATSPYCNVDNTFTIYDDGTIRFDRIITFVASQKMNQWFYYMHTFDNSAPVLTPGRMGYGQQVINGFDPRQYLAAPAAATVAQGTSGTYGAVTRNYYLTAITAQGETLLGTKVTSTTASGTTNSFTLTMPSTVTGQTGWGIYDDTGLLTRIPAAQTTWVDANPTIGSAKASTVSTATVLPGTQQYQRVRSDRADWAALYDADVSGIAFGVVTDRDNALSYPGATVLECELESHPGVLKNYWQLFDGLGRQPVNDPTKTDSYTQTIANGTVLTTTAYSFTYAPLDRANWHREIANRGQGFKQFGTVYPST